MHQGRKAAVLSQTRGKFLAEDLNSKLPKSNLA